MVKYQTAHYNPKPIFCQSKQLRFIAGKNRVCVCAVMAVNEKFRYNPQDSAFCEAVDLFVYILLFYLLILTYDAV